MASDQIPEIVRQMHRELALPTNYAEISKLPFFSEVPLSDLVVAELDYTGRPLVVTTPTAEAWLKMNSAARKDGIELRCFSGFRGYVYQKGLIEAKLKKGVSLDEILRVLAAPGYSEHHSGRAIDITTIGCPPAEGVFAHTAAYAWLCAHANTFGFTETYGSNHPYTIMHEPWHWCFND